MVDERCRERFLNLFEIETDGSCWGWTGPMHNCGYGALGSTLAHRFSYELFVGPIPAGLDVDHLCRNRRCVNPEHLEVVTRAENVLRGIGIPAINARKTHCFRGHPFDETNTGTGMNYNGRPMRRCRRCDMEKHRTIRAEMLPEERAAWLYRRNQAGRRRKLDALVAAARSILVYEDTRKFRDRSVKDADAKKRKVGKW